jgi:hypothetical protein
VIERLDVRNPPGRPAGMELHDRRAHPSVQLLTRAGVATWCWPSAAAPEVRFYVPAWTRAFRTEAQLRRALRDVMWRDAKIAVHDAEGKG